MSTYFKNISLGITTTVAGLRLTLRHLFQARKRRKNVDIRSRDFYREDEGMVTIQYPLETIPIPDNGRYRLHNEIDDCIVCDKCVKICPVDCIEIEPIKAVEEVGRASDGSPIRLYAARFDIDMAKCCYCGLCTTVCPTECLTMTKTFDYSELDVRDMVYNYSNLTPEQADEKRALLDQFQKEKEAMKAAKPAATIPAPAPATPAARPVFKPTAKPKPKEEPAEDKAKVEEKPVSERPKPVFKPTIKPKAAPAPEESTPVEATLPATEMPVQEAPAATPAAPKPAFRPTMKPKAAPAAAAEPKQEVEAKAEPEKPESAAAPAPAKPAFRPTMKPKTAPPAPVEPAQTPVPEQPVSEPKPEAPVETEPVAARPKPAFRPTMKPKPKNDQPD